MNLDETSVGPTEDVAFTVAFDRLARGDTPSDVELHLLRSGVGSELAKKALKMASRSLEFKRRLKEAEVQERNRGIQVGVAMVFVGVLAIGLSTGLDGPNQRLMFRIGAAVAMIGAVQAGRFLMSR